MKKTITKADIVEALYQRVAKEKREVKNYVDNLIELIKKTLSSDKSLLISGFGKFQVYEKKERKGRNPKTEEPIILSPRRVCVFKISKKFKNKLNQ